METFSFRINLQPREQQNSVRVRFTIVEIYGMFTFEVLLRLWTRRAIAAKVTQTFERKTSLDNNDVEKENVQQKMCDKIYCFTTPWG